MPVKDRLIRIFSASGDQLLNHSRALFLRRYGFEVTTTISKQEASKQLETGTYDVLIFGATLPTDACWELAEIFRKRNSKGKIIEVVPSATSPPKNRPDAIVSADEPIKLVATIYAQLS